MRSKRDRGLLDAPAKNYFYFSELLLPTSSSPSQSGSINQHRLITNRSCSHLSVEWISEANSSEGGRGGGRGREKRESRLERGRRTDPEDGLDQGTIVPLLTGLLPS